MANENNPSTRGSHSLLSVVIVIAVLYFARVVFIPIALSILMAFLLAPLAVRLKHWHFGRVPSAIIVVALSFFLASVVGTLMSSQMADLAHKLPEYQQNVRQKLNSIRASGGGVINRATRFVHNISEDLLPPTPPAARPQAGEDKPVPVEIRKTAFAPVDMAQKVLGPVINIFFTAMIITVFVIFLLVYREDVRDRIIRLFGEGRVQVTTLALDDATSRLGRYLIVQLGINSTFGLLVGAGLYFIGIPNPLLWGLLAIILRYIPYLGVWVAAVMPALLAFAVDPGWVKVPVIFGMYFVVDLIIWNFVEPMLYGGSTGTSPLAILVAAVFWTWLWGPVGLLLSIPLTVCVVVLGRYVPSLEWLSILLSDEPTLGPETRFYQRMLAMDLEEAAEVVEEFLKGKSLEELDDKLLIPALSLAEEDRHRGRLDEEHQKFIFENTRLLVEDIGERADELIAGNGSLKAHLKDKRVPNSHEGPETETAEVLCIPARDEADELAALMLNQLLGKKGVPSKVFSFDSLAGECVQEIQKGHVRIACVAAIPPFGYMHARYLCRKLREQFPDLKIVAAILTESDPLEIRKREPAIPVDELGATLKQALTAILSFMPKANKQRPAPAPG